MTRRKEATYIDRSTSWTHRDARCTALAVAICLTAAVTVEHMDSAQATPLWWEAHQTRAVMSDARHKGHGRTEPANPTPLPDELYRAVLAACEAYDVPTALALGVMDVESGFRAEAMGIDGRDYGLYQIRDSNHAWLTEATGADPLTPAGNIECGVYMLSYLLARYETADGALTAYRWGRDTGDREYASAVLEAAEKWR